MRLGLATSGLVFPAVSFLMLAYGQRYVASTGRIRQLVSDWSTILVPIPSVCARSKFFDAAWG